MKNVLNANIWNNIYSRFNTHFRPRLLSKYYAREQVRLLDQWVEKSKGGHVLITDLFNESFGHVDSLLWLSNRGYHITGIDISSKIVLKIKNNQAPNVSCVVCDILHLPFKNNIFNYVISFSTLDHFDEHCLITSLREIHRVTVRGGDLIITLHNSQNIFLYFYFLNLSKKLPFLLKCYSIKKSSRLIETCNFRIKKTEAITHILFPGTLNVVISWCEKYNKHKILKAIDKLLRIFEFLGKWDTKYFTGKCIALFADKAE